jgi:Flp pilus assembly protein TadD
VVCLCHPGGRLSSEAERLRLKEAARLYIEGDKQAATDIWREILRQDPRQPEALHRLGIVAQEAGNAELALRLIEAALRLDAGYAEAWFNRGVLLRKAGRMDEALQSTRLSLEILPSLAQAWDLIGQILKDTLDYTGAADAYRKAIALKSDCAPFHSNHALLLMALDERAEAYRALRRAEALDPAGPALMLGNMLKAYGYPERAADMFARARGVDIGDRQTAAEAAASEAMARLQIGDTARGWALWEQRPDLEASLNHLPLWQEERHGSKTSTLLVYEDQGIGDALHFIRYLPLLRPFADRIVLRVRAPLRRLCADNFPGIDVIGEDDSMPASTARCRLASLPALFSALPKPPPPYLKAPANGPALPDTLRAPRIGLCWAGNAQFNNDRQRSIPFPLLAPVLACGTEHFIPLQKERTGEAVAAGLIDVSGSLRDMGDTAALVAALDLVISVDTAVAHLAGAMGKPVWLLLAFDNDWRWLIGRRDTPWYPTATLFRQKAPGDWGGVIAEVAETLSRLTAGNRGVLTPPPWDGNTLRENPCAVPLPV